MVEAAHIGGHLPQSILAGMAERGVAKIMGLKFSGFVAWWLWRTIYLSKLPRLEKKIRVALAWTLDILFPKDGGIMALPRDISNWPEDLQYVLHERAAIKEHDGYLDPAKALADAEAEIRAAEATGK